MYGPNVMRGYHNRADETRAVLGEDGGLRTGDLGYLDDDGYLYITGRIKEQYKLANGKYVSPGVLEERLKLSPFITDLMIYGDGRTHNVALVVPDLAAVRAWATEARIALGGRSGRAARRRARAREDRRRDRGAFAVVPRLRADRRDRAASRGLHAAKRHAHPLDEAQASRDRGPLARGDRASLPRTLAHHHRRPTNKNRQSLRNSGAFRSKA